MLIRRVAYASYRRSLTTTDGRCASHIEGETKTEKKQRINMFEQA